MPWICGEPGCKKQPYYSEPGQKKPRFCFLHKLPGHIDVRNKRCEVPNCEIRPHYGYDGEAPRFCAQHRAEGMHNLRSRRCQSEGCVRYASCGHGGTPPVFCGAHKTVGMVNLIGRRCAVELCETYASYGVNGEKARYCAKHKGTDMVNLTVKQCEFSGCNTQPSFNFAGQRKARFCATHRLEHMVDVLDRHCAQHGCDRQPIYGQAGEKEGRPMWCPDHRPAGSFDVKTSRCQEPGCLKHPSYGYDKDRIRRRCRLHKLEDMVDVKSPRCEMIGCRKQPCCGFPGLKPRFCSEHKQEGMLNLKTRAFRCKYRGAAGLGMGMLEDPMMPMPVSKSAPCNRACRYAYPGEEAVYCAKHKMDGMVDVVNPSCKMQDCPERPTHGYDGEPATFCEAHMAHGMKLVASIKPPALHWSAELRRQATSHPRERGRMDMDMNAGCARCVPLPPKHAGSLTERLLMGRIDPADVAAIEAAAASNRGPEAAAANDFLNTREMLSASTSPIVPPYAPSGLAHLPPRQLLPPPAPAPAPPSDDMLGPSSITSAELALAFSGIVPDEESMTAAAAAHCAATAAAAANAANAGGGEAAAALARVPGFSAPLPALPGIGTEAGPARKRRRGEDGTATATDPAADLDSDSATAPVSATAAAADAYAAAIAAATAQFGDPAAFHAVYSSELMAAMTSAAAAAAAATAASPASAPAGGSLLLPQTGDLPTPMEVSPAASMAPAPVGVSDPNAGAMLAPPTPEVMAAMAVVPAVGSSCAVAECVAPATFGHPGPGHVPTHCLTHCEEGMHRLAADAAGTRVAPPPAVADFTGTPREPTSANELVSPVGAAASAAAAAAAGAAPMVTEPPPPATEVATHAIAGAAPEAYFEAAVGAAATDAAWAAPQPAPGAAPQPAPGAAPDAASGVVAGSAGGAAREPQPASQQPEELGRGKRNRKKGTTAAQGIMLLAGAVTSHTDADAEGGGEDDPDTEDKGVGEEAGTAALVPIPAMAAS